MSARSDILAAIGAVRVPPSPPAAERPVSTVGIADLREQFLRTLEAVRGTGVICPANHSLDTLLATILGPDRTAAMVAPGRFAVAENGAVYVDAEDLEDRAAIIGAERLVLVVPAAAMVATMHEAVRLIPRDSRCGWFLSGPSKTADIEQALVIGAQGARVLHVVLTF